MKRTSEALLGEALRELDLEPYVYRLPDPKTGAGVSNWKPCDFMVWWPVEDGGLRSTQSAWIEAKDNDQVATFPYADLRPSQIAGMLEASRLGIPYLLAVYWRKHRRWTISDAVQVLAWFNKDGPGNRSTSIALGLLASKFGIDSLATNLAQTIKVILEDGW